MIGKDNITLLKAINRMRESQQQYAVPGKEVQGKPENSQGSEGEIKIVNEGDTKGLYVKGEKEWFNVGMSQSTQQTGIVSSSTATTSAEPGQGPILSISAQLSGNVHVILTYDLGDATSFTLKRAAAGSSAYVENGSTLLTESGTSFTDTSLTTAATWYYMLTATNGSATTASPVSITTNALYTSHNINILNPQAGDNTAWTDGQLVECAEFEEPSNFTGAVDVISKHINDSTFVDGAILYDNSNGTTPFNGEAFDASATGNNFFALNGSSVDRIFQVATNGVLSNSINCTPAAPSVSLNVVNDGRIDLSITGHTRVVRNYVIQRKTGSGNFATIATIAPSAKGNLANSNTVTTYQNTSLNAGINYVYRVLAKNDTFTGAYSSEVNATTNTASTAWSNVPADFSISIIGNPPLSSSDFSTGKTITLSAGNGDTVIACQQPSSGSLAVAVSTSGEPSLSASYGVEKTISNATTYYIRFKYTNLKGANLSAESRTVTFTNNNTSNTGLQITVSTG